MQGWKEGAITFNPTFKYKLGTSIYLGKGKGVGGRFVCKAGILLLVSDPSRSSLLEMDLTTSVARPRFA